MGSPNPPGQTFTGLFGVDCTTSTTCIAVGTYETKNWARTLIERWNGSQWNVVPVQQDATIGWNTAIHEFNGKLYLSYWRVPIGSRGLAMFARAFKRL